jgi:hypothetical protein
MGVNNPAEHDVGVAVGHDLCHPAFEDAPLASGTRNGRTFTDGAGVRLAQSNSSLLAREVARGEAHSLQEVHRDDIGNEFGHLAEVLRAVLNASRPEGRRKAGPFPSG